MERRFGTSLELLVLQESRSEGETVEIASDFPKLMVFRRLFSHISQIISDFVETLFNWVDLDFVKIFDRRFTILDCRLIDFRLLDFFVEICYENDFMIYPM